MENNKEIIDTYFKTRIKDLETYFNKYCMNDCEYWNNMISELYIHLIDNIDKLSSIIEKGDIHYYCVKFIYNQRNWKQTDFKKTISEKENMDITNIKDFVENDFQSTLIESKLKEQVIYEDKVNCLNIIVSSLDLHEKILWRMYTVENKSMREIGKNVGVSHTSIFYLLKEIKNRIINLHEKNMLEKNNLI